MKLSQLLSLTKSERKKREIFRCIHRHNGLSHSNCYDEKNGLIEKVGFLDIEATHLKAPWGIVLTYCIKELGGKLIARSVTRQELYHEKYDKELLKDLINDIKQFTRIVVQYGTDRKFDLPFLRTRAVKWKLDFPTYKSLFVTDTHTILKNKFCLHRNSQEVACDFFGIPAKQHKLKPNIWTGMISGNPRIIQKTLNYVLTHNKEDVISLEKLYKKINVFVPRSKTSI